MQWFNEPPSWKADGKTITVQVGPKTDFWRKTHDGGNRHHGHLYFQKVTGDFTASVKVTGQYVGLYDHAGIMVRLDEATWLKCGIEFVEGVQNASSVITHDWSDWAIRPLANPASIWLRVVRHGGTVEVYLSLDGATYDLIRQGYLTEVATVEVGVMAAAPTGTGFSVRFDDFTIAQ
jgi:regulation of enolase protein 1 (concanavalin A-like superfamily)